MKEKRIFGFWAAVLFVMSNVPPGYAQSGNDPYGNVNFMGGTGTQGKGPRQGGGGGGAGPEAWSPERQNAQFPGEAGAEAAQFYPPPGGPVPGAAPAHDYAAEGSPARGPGVESAARPGAPKSLQERLEEARASALGGRPKVVKANQTPTRQRNLHPAGEVKGPAFGGSEWEYQHSRRGSGSWQKVE